MATSRFQIISDLHLESPIQSPSYTFFSSPSQFPLLAPNLLLLGDIGLIAHTEPLLTFLRSILQRDPHMTIFYVLGNHEPYQMTPEDAISQMQTIEATLNSEFGCRFHIMEKRRIDLTPTLTLLGCTLWTHVPAHHAHEVTAALKDFDSTHGILDRSVDDHNAGHARDLAWLNAQVARIEEREPHREIVVLTHHSPTTDSRANSSRFPPERPLNSGFRTDLRGERCWTSPQVRMWAFGHTHFSCQFVDAGDSKETGDGPRSGDGRRKLVVSNQKGYAYSGGEGNWRIEPMVVAREDGEWRVVVGEKTSSQ